jgi:hypothetical protein
MALFETVTVAVAAGLSPAEPVQTNEYVVFAASEPVFWVPLTASVPVQPAEAVHLVVLSELHVSTAVPPGAITVGLTVSVAVGPVTTETVAVAAWLVPPSPEHVREKVVSAERAAEACVPLVASAPVQPPVAAQAVASVELQVKVEVVPGATEVGSALKVAVGIIWTVVVTGWLVPPPPVQLSVKSVDAVSAPVLWLPLAAREPLQPPEAMHEVAFVELHVRVVSSPWLTAVLAAVSVAVGAGGVEEPPPPQPNNNNVTPIDRSGSAERIESPRRSSWFSWIVRHRGGTCP